MFVFVVVVVGEGVPEREGGTEESMIHTYTQSENGIFVNKPP